jgi:hypothetical protein
MVRPMSLDALFGLQALSIWQAVIVMTVVVSEYVVMAIPFLIAAIAGIIASSVILCSCCQSVLLEANVKIVRTSFMCPLIETESWQSCSLHFVKTCQLTCKGATLRR